MCVCACVRACVRACVFALAIAPLWHSPTNGRLLGKSLLDLS